MFSSRKILAGLLALVLAWGSPASAQLATTHAGTVGGPTSTPVSNACINSSNTTITFTAQGTGNASATRVSVVSIAWSDSTAAGTAELTGMTIGGITMTRAVRTNGDDQNSNSEIWFVLNPTGATANIVATFSTAVDGVTIEVYSLKGFNTASPLAVAVGSTNIIQTYNNKQVAIAVGSRTVNVSTSLSNLTTDFSSACGASLWGIHSSKALNGNNQTLTTTISPVSNNPKIALAVWNVSGPGVCTESAAFLARTSGLDSRHAIAYDTMICGLVSDGVFAKLDMLHVYATQDSATSLLNLVSASFAGTNHSAVFTADSGWKGTHDGSDYIDTGFNPTTASSPKFTQNSAHVSFWGAVNDGLGTGGIVGGGNALGASQSNIFPYLTADSKTYFQVNDVGLAGATGVNTTQGHFVANRSSSVQVTGYRNGSSVLSNGAAASVALANISFDTLSWNNNGTHTGSGVRGGAASIGSSLSAGEVTAFYNRLHTYFLAIGVIPTGTCAESTAFFDRVWALDIQHINAYDAMICGLVSDGVWSSFDAIWVFATQDSITALLNLVSTSYAALNSGDTFTVNRGFQATDGSSNHVDSGFNPITATTPKFVQNSAHISAWGTVSFGSSIQPIIGSNAGGPVQQNNIYPWYTDNNAYFRTNTAGNAGVAHTGSAGYFLSNRSSSVQSDGYINGASVLSNGADTSVAPANLNMDITARNDNGTHRANGTQIGLATIGSSLSGGQVTSTYNRFRTYMTAVGVP